MTQATQTLPGTPHVIMVDADFLRAPIQHVQMGRDHEHAAKMFVLGLLARSTDVSGFRMAVTSKDRTTKHYQAEQFVPAPDAIAELQRLHAERQI